LKSDLSDDIFDNKSIRSKSSTGSAWVTFSWHQYQ
jgi:hypothetical protein